MPLHKRSVRLGINLTPDQGQQLKLAAQQASQSPARYAYEQLCFAMENPFLQVPSRSMTPEQAEQLADLYGLLDVLVEILDENRTGSQIGPQSPELLSRLQQVNQALVQTQQVLISLSVESHQKLP